MPYFTGNNRIDSLLTGFQAHWAGAGSFATAQSVTFSFAQFEVPASSSPTNGQTSFNAAQQTAARAALQSWSDVADISFTEVTDTGVFTGDGIARGDINFVNSTSDPDFDLGSGVLAFAFFPSGFSAASNRFTEFVGDRAILHYSGLLDFKSTFSSTYYG